MPPSASWKRPDAIAMRARERAFHVAEELALEQLVRNRRAIDLDERPLAARAARVDHVRHELLADAGLAFDEHARRRLRDGLEPHEHLLQRRALADDAAEVHRDLHFLAQIVALALELVAQPRVLLECRAQLALRSIARRDVLRRHQQRDDGAARVAIAGRGDFDLEDVAGLRHVGARLVLELARRDDVLQAPAAERRLHLLAHELRDHAAEHFFAAIAERFEPAVADVRDAAVLVDGVQHRRRRAIELAVVLLEPRLLADLGVDHHRAQVIAGLAALDDRVREAVDALVVARDEIDGHSGQDARCAAARASTPRRCASRPPGSRDPAAACS